MLENIDLQAFVERMPFMFCRFKADGTILSINQRYCDAFNKKREELIGYSFFNFIPEPDRPAVRKNYLSLNLEKPSITYEHGITAPDGSVRYHRWTDWAFFDASGNVVEFHSVGEDITDLKLAEERLKASEQRFRRLADLAPVAIFQTDAEGKCLFVNRAWSDMSGVSAAEIHGDVFMRALHPEDRERMEGLRSAIILHPSGMRTEYRLLRSDGQLIWVLGSALPLFNAEGVFEGIVGVDVDISDSKRAEELLEAREEMYRNMFQDNSAVMMIIDPEDFSIVDANEAAQRYYGYSRRELLSMRESDILTLSRQEMYDELCRAREENRRYFIMKHRLASGEVREVEVYAGPISVKGRGMAYVIIHDIADRVRMELALRESEQKLEAFFNYSPLGVILYDVEKRFRSWNNYMERITGKKASEVIGKTFSELFPAGPDLKRDKFLDRALAGETVQTTEMPNPVLHKGISGHLSMFFAPLRDGDGNIQGVIHILMDVKKQHGKGRISCST